MALERFKLAYSHAGGPSQDSAAGADHGVMPVGPEVSHGTERRPYAAAGQGLQGLNYDSEFLWNISDLNHMAPGMTGSYGQETIG